MADANATPRMGGLGVTHCDFCGKPEPLDDGGYCVACRRSTLYLEIHQVLGATAVVEAAVRAAYARPRDIYDAVERGLAGPYPDTGRAEATLEELHDRLRPFIDLGEDE